MTFRGQRLVWGGDFLFFIIFFFGGLNFLGVDDIFGSVGSRRFEQYTLVVFRKMCGWCQKILLFSNVGSVSKIFSFFATVWLVSKNI